MESRQTILITGAAKRLGASLATALHVEGWNIALHYHHSQSEAEALAERLGERCQLFQADLTDEAQANALLPRVVETCGGVDAVIHNASLFERDNLADFTWARAEKHMRLHTLAATSLAAAFHAYRADRAEAPAPFVLLGDGLKGWSHSAEFLSYGLSCASLETLPALLGETLAPEIRINLLALGLTLAQPDDDPEMFDRIAAKTPLARASSVEEMVDAVRWLLRAHSVTGQVISLAGGQHLPQRIHPE